MVAEAVHHIRQRIDAACLRAGRSAHDVTLVAVAKTFSARAVVDALRAGVPDIGENYVQEFTRKRSELAQEAVRWHFIGHLQRNKVKAVVGRAELIHAVDSARLAAEIDRCARDLGIVQEVLVEVNTSGEESKYGVPPAGTVALVSEIAAMRSLRCSGLMTIGPFLPEAESSRGAFRALARLRDELAAQGLSGPHLSMGMTNDFEVAIEEGATMIRIGTAIFGRRTAPPAPGDGGNQEGHTTVEHP
jgi:pyridoxal phosphate enzyme (YggS family)